ncbi:MAG: hypothetical protein QOF18_1474 [Frankiaceae bacterium]|nr:hypothetical protein [Frankiaceae bacterium]
MATAWDKHSTKGLAKLQDTLVREQVRHVLAPFSPYWKQRLAELGKPAMSMSSAKAVATLPAAGERDVSPHGDPAGMAALVVQATESGFALHAHGPTLRRALRLRATKRDAYRRLVDHDTKPTAYAWTGLGFRYPVASTRGDLDVIARAGARLWKVLGLSSDDALLSALPAAATTEHTALHYAALATGTPALFPGGALADVAAAARLAAPTVIAVAAANAPAVIDAITAGGGSLERLRTLLLVGAPSAAERAAALAAVDATRVAVLAVHAPAGARVMWGECREAGADGGLHTYPDLDLVQLVDAETGEPADAGPAEVVLTQLGLRGSALLRWRTGDLATGGIDATRCPGCKRRVPRVVGVRRRALVLVSADGRSLDLRALAGALAGRSELSDWRVVLGARKRDGRAQVVVHFATNGDPGEAAVATAADVRAVAGILPTQMVDAQGALAGVVGEPLTRRILQRS